MHPRKTRLPPLPRRYFLLSALRSFVRWFSRQGAYVSRQRWRLPGAGALADVRALQLDQGGAPGAIYCSRAQPRDRLESLVVRAEIAHACRGHETGGGRPLPVCGNSFARARRVGGTGSLGDFYYLRQRDRYECVRRLIAKFTPGRCDNEPLQCAKPTP